jgi:hypothetical protein
MTARCKCLGTPEPTRDDGGKFGLSGGLAEKKKMSAAPLAVLKITAKYYIFFHTKHLAIVKQHANKGLGQRPDVGTSLEQNLREKSAMNEVTAIITLTYLT